VRRRSPLKKTIQVNLIHSEKVVGFSNIFIIYEGRRKSLKSINFISAAELKGLN